MLHKGCMKDICLDIFFCFAGFTDAIRFWIFRISRKRLVDCWGTWRCLWDLPQPQRCQLLLLIRSPEGDPRSLSSRARAQIRFEATTPTLQFCNQQTLEVTIFLHFGFGWAIPKSLRRKDFKISRICWLKKFRTWCQCPFNGHICPGAGFVLVQQLKAQKFGFFVTAHWPHSDKFCGSIACPYLTSLCPYSQKQKNNNKRCADWNYNQSHARS